MSDHKEKKEEVKEDLSRMEGAYGKQLIGKLKQMKVLVVGLKGLGVEVAKNLILAGPHTVHLHDDDKVGIADLGANFYLRAEDVGKPRAQMSYRALGEMNPNVNVFVHSGEIDEKFLSGLNVLVVTDATVSRAELTRLNDTCRRHDVKFIYAVNNGLFVTIFSDFGQAHRCFDHDGALLSTLVIEHIDMGRDGKPTVITIDGKRHGMADGEVVKIEEVKLQGQSDQKGQTLQSDGQQVVFKPGTQASSITGLFEIKCHRIGKHEDHRKFEIAACGHLGEYENGGLATQVKVERIFNYQSLAQQLNAPKFEPHYEDFSKFGRMDQLHFARLALFEFQANAGRLPALHDRKDAREVIAYAKAILAYNKNLKGRFTVDSIDEKLLTQVCLYATTEITALAALFGGIVAQEIVKQTGKYTPITQWIHFDALELLHADIPVDATPVGSRYDHLISIFGKSFQSRLGKQNLFMVGCGALGCEYLKAIAMLGLGCNGGTVHITDMDTIELSNLSRQFLFRRKHVNKAKSVSAGMAAVEMNPELKRALKVHETKVDESTEDIFNDQFWGSLNFVVNALDNIKARMYTDQQCVLHGIPLFESGTLGTSANTVIVLPHLTASYSEGAVAGEGQGIAQCTLQNFPSLPLHCIEFAREKFDELFVGGAQKLHDFIENPENFLSRNAQEGLAELGGLQEVKRWLDLFQQASVQTCVNLAFQEFTKRYRDGILDLTNNFPENARTTDKSTGADLGPFWRGHKRFPRTAVFSVDDPSHVDFIFHTTNIFCSIFGLEEISEAKVKELVSTCHAAEWRPGKKIVLDEGDDKKEKSSEEPVVAEDDRKEIEALKQVLRSINVAGLRGRKLVPADFDKDSDTNHHVDWITAATNLRSFNYYIKPSSRAECRMTAGRIIPAIATTTATITGFIQLEMLKYLLGRPLDDHRACTIDLGVNSFVIEKLGDPRFHYTSADAKVIPNKFTTWDKIIIDQGNLSVQELMDQFPSLYHGLKIESLWKHGLTAQEIKDGKGKAIVQTNNPFAASIGMANRMKNSPNEGTRAKAQQTIDNHKAWETEHHDRTPKLIDKYIRVNGPLPPGRNYILLDGAFVDDEDAEVTIPTIKYIFA